MIGQYVYCVAFNSSGRVAGDAAQITGNLSKDGGTRTALNDVTPDDEGNGVYRFTLTTGERTGSIFSFDFASSTPGVNVLPLLTVLDGVNLNAVAGTTVNTLAELQSANTVKIHSSSEPLNASAVALTDIGDHITGSTWPGLAVTALYDTTCTPINLTNATITMEVRLLQDQVSADLTIASPDVAIVNATLGTFTIGPVAIALAAANYFYKVKVVTEAGSTYIVKRGRWNIVDA